MEHKLPPLPYAMDALDPHISKETLEYHYGKHHANYIAHVNKAIPGTKFADMTLEQIVMQSTGGLFDYAAQCWNHSFYWNSMSPKGGGEPKGELAAAINKTFGSFSKFKDEFILVAASLFGSGWVWLVKETDGKLGLEISSNAGTPIKNGKKPLITCDVWEHAYYIDYRNLRTAYVDAWFQVANWDFAAANYK
ncbi:MAG TPA: superoxide dismutase [Candidatus Omnitrophota bacterium]|nr:superoxide dismutase [Candidatus Omnitrophota bacterium]